VINDRIKAEAKPLFDDVHTILKAKGRDRADDILLKKQLNERMDVIQRDMRDIDAVVQETLCPMVTCLFENQTM
jgi:ElaB/YqjD/DUF883 family membrane-anchored ribosome-binding protein